MVADAGAIFLFSFLPTVDPVTVPFTEAPPKPLSLDCAEEYAVFVTGNDYRTRIDAIACESIQWSRMLDEASEASITVPDRFTGLRCLSDVGGLQPWVGTAG